MGTKAFLITALILLTLVLPKLTQAGLDSATSPPAILAQGQPTPSPSPTTAQTTVNIQNFQFVPQQITISPNTTVTWTNLDSSPHTTTSNNVNAAETWDSGTILQGRSFSKTFTRPGTYTYRCTLHPNMPQGTIIVLAATQTATPSATLTPSPTPTPSPAVTQTPTSVGIGQTTPAQPPPQNSTTTQLPTTGPPAAALAALASLLPIGFKIANFDKIRKEKISANYIWQERQFKL